MSTGCLTPPGLASSSGAEGNPFFLEEILRQLIDEGRIVREGTRWKATDGLERVELPDTVQAVLAARIDLLEPSEKHTLQQASVVGRVFWRGAVTALVADRETVDPDLRRLEERELVSERLTSSLLGEEELAFSHILTRDVAYETLPRRERPNAHARVASWIEETTGDRHGEFVGLLAHHYGEAYRGARVDRSYDPGELELLRERTFELLVEGSTVALRGAAYRGARSLAESALEVAATPEERATAFEALGHGYKHAGFGDGAWSSYASGSRRPRRVRTRASARSGRTAVRARARSRVQMDGDDRRASRRGGGRRLSRGRAGAARRRRRRGAREADDRPVVLGARVSADRTGVPGSRRRATRPGSRRRRWPRGSDGPTWRSPHSTRCNTTCSASCGTSDAADAARHRLEIAALAGDLAELGDSFAVAAWNTLYLGVVRRSACGRSRRVREPRLGWPDLRSPLTLVERACFLLPR